MADLRMANLSEADLRWANLSGANLNGANLTAAKLGETNFGAANLREVEGLAKSEFGGPCILDVRAIQISGKLPLPFLRGCGLPDSLIEYLPSLLNEPIQFYSCFISYSTKDQDFADRLYADLQNNGVRCWFAPHDIQGGRKVHKQIDEAIRVYDKLLLILSEASMNSNWVKTEIGNARAREEQQKRQMFVSNSIVGCNLFTFIDGAEVKHFYKALAERVLRTGVAVAFPYRCDGPKLRREMTMHLSCDAGMVRYESTVIRETPREREIPRQTPNTTTLVAMCSICQRYRFPITSTVWKDLEGLLTEPGLPYEFRFTHGICEECYAKLRADML